MTWTKTTGGGGGVSQSCGQLDFLDKNALLQGSTLRVSE